ncbi:MAG: 3-phosphoshikimate 1-carboxyvinyltransferase, partial [Acidobacteriota bacterium]
MSRQAGNEVAAPRAPSKLAGTIRVPPSKSLTQRALVVAAMAGAGARVADPLDAEDPRLLAAALGATGHALEWRGDEVVVGERRPTGGGLIHMGNNGTGARFMLAQLAATPGRWVLDGTRRLRERPFAPLVDALGALGADIAAAGGPAA